MRCDLVRAPGVYEAALQRYVEHAEMQTTAVGRHVVYESREAVNVPAKRVYFCVNLLEYDWVTPAGASRSAESQRLFTAVRRLLPEVRDFCEIAPRADA